MIRNIVFDLGGVLVDLDLERCVRSFLALARDPEQTLASMRAGDMLGNGGNTSLHDYELGEISTEQYLTGMLPACRDGVTADQLRDAVMSVLSSFPDSRRQAILRLRQKGYRTFLLSNINDLHWDACLPMFTAPILDPVSGETVSLPLSAYFDDVFLSQRLHLTKPDPRIYEVVALSTDIVPAETLYFDDVLANVQGGLAAGWDARQVSGDEWLAIAEALPPIA